MDGLGSGQTRIITTDGSSSQQQQQEHQPRRCSSDARTFMPSLRRIGRQLPVASRKQYRPGTTLDARHLVCHSRTHLINTHIHNGLASHSEPGLPAARAVTTVAAAPFLQEIPTTSTSANAHRKSPGRSPRLACCGNHITRRPKRCRPYPGRRRPCSLSPPISGSPPA